MTLVLCRGNTIPSKSDQIHVPYAGNDLDFMSEVCIPCSRAIFEPLQRDFSAILQQTPVNISISTSSYDVIPREVPSSLLDVLKCEPDHCGTLLKTPQPQPSLAPVHLSSPPLQPPTLPPEKPEPNRNRNHPRPTTNQDHQYHHHLPPTLAPRIREIEGEQALGSTYIRGPEVIRDRRRIDRRVDGAVRDIPDGGAVQVGRDVGQAHRADGAGGAVLERLVAAGGDAAPRGAGDDGIELGQGGDVHAPLRDPGGLEAAGAADVEARDERVDEGLVILPAGLGGVERGEEVAGELEVAGQDEAEPLLDVAARGGGAARGAGGRGDEVAEDGEVEWAGGAGGGGRRGVVLGPRRREAEEEEGEEEGERGGGAAEERRRHRGSLGFRNPGRSRGGGGGAPFLFLLFLGWFWGKVVELFEENEEEEEDRCEFW